MPTGIVMALELYCLCWQMQLFFLYNGIIWIISFLPSDLTLHGLLLKCKGMTLWPSLFSMQPFPPVGQTWEMMVRRRTFNIRSEHADRLRSQIYHKLIKFQVFDCRIRGHTWVGESNADIQTTFCHLIDEYQHCTFKIKCNRCCFFKFITSMIPRISEAACVASDHLCL